MKSKFSKIASSIIHPTNNVRLKSFINRDNKKDACTMRDPCLGLALLQIAVMVDNVPAGIAISWPALGHDPRSERCVCL